MFLTLRLGLQDESPCPSDQQGVLAVANPFLWYASTLHYWKTPRPTATTFQRDRSIDLPTEVSVSQELCTEDTRLLGSTWPCTGALSPVLWAQMEKRQTPKVKLSHCIAAWGTPQKIPSLGTGTKRCKTTDSEGLQQWPLALRLVHAELSNFRRTRSTESQANSFHQAADTGNNFMLTYWISHWRMVSGELKPWWSSSGAEAESVILPHCAFSLPRENGSCRSIPQYQKKCITYWLRFHRNSKDLESLRSNNIMQRRWARHGKDPLSCWGLFGWLSL